MTQSLSTNILILGGGLTGLPLACVLGTAGIEVTCVDRDVPSVQATEEFDGRTTAISAASRRVLVAAGVWDKMAPHACPIKDIRVADGASPLYLHFDSDEVADDEAFGWIIENRLLRQALFDRIAEIDAVTHIAPAAVTGFDHTPSHVTLTLSDDRTIQTKLLVGADGRGSPTREWLGIETVGWRYKQTAIVCCVEHALDHEFVAVEHFQPAGPFAVLPMTDAEDGTHRSSVVWTEHGGDVETYMDLSESDFNAALQTHFGPHLGAVKQIGGRYSFPLGLQHAKKYTGPRTALIGEAAHVMHPIAGQGLNMSLRDVAALAELIADHSRLGLDIGAKTLLDRYQRWRKLDNMMMMAATDGLNRLFSNDIMPIKKLRRTGLGLVERIPPAKRFFMKQAMGLSQGPGAPLPRLMRGQAL